MPSATKAKKRAAPVTSRRGHLPEDWKARIWNLRYALYIKQEHLAALLGLNPMTVSRWENGRAFPSLWHWTLIEEFELAATADFDWQVVGRWSHRDALAYDATFLPVCIPDRLREVLAAALDGRAKAVKAVKAKAKKKSKG